MSFSITQATQSQSYAYKCWYNYNYGGNTMGISESEMTHICDTWKGQLSNWKATASKDENQYEITDDKLDNAKSRGKENAKKETGYNGKTGKAWTRAAGDAAMAGAGAAAKNIGKGVGKVAFKKAASKGLEGGAIDAGKKAAGKATFIIGATLALATGLLYQLKKPNKDEVEAARQLRDETLIDAQEQLNGAQEQIEEATEESMVLSDKAEEINEEANEQIESDKTEFDQYKVMYDALKAKDENGQQLTEDEKELMKTLAPMMEELGEGMTKAQEEATDVVSEKYEAIGDLQGQFDEAAEITAEVEGLTDYAEGFDKQTRVMCFVEAGAQTLNVTSGLRSALKAGKFAMSGGWFTAWAWAFAAMGAAGAAMSGAGAAQQVKWAGEVGQEIEVREATQDLGVDTTDLYDESIDIYDGTMDIVSDLEIDMPDNLEVPEYNANTEIPVAATPEEQKEKKVKEDKQEK